MSQETSTVTREETRPTVQPNYQASPVEGGYELRVELPDVKKGAVSLGVEDETLTIEARRGYVPPSDWKLIHHELPHADFRLQLRLNPEVEVERVTANLTDGVLHVSLPKAEVAKPRQISVE